MTVAVSMKQGQAEKVLPKGWQWVRLGDHVTKIGSGITPRGGQAIYLKSGIPLIRSQNVHLNTFQPLGLAYISAEQDNLMQSSRVVKGDVLLNITGASIGRVCVVPNDLCPANVNQHVSIIRSDESIDPAFLAFYISNPEFQKLILELESGATRQALTKTQIENFIIPLPPLKEQQRIVAILNEKMVAISAAQTATLAQIEAASALPGAYLRQVFDSPEAQQWECKKLGEITYLERGKFTHRPRNDPKFYGGDFPWIQTGDVERCGKYIVNYSNTLNNNGLSISKLFAKGTLVITIAANIGAIGILTFDSCMPDSLVGIKPKSEEIETSFIYYFLLHIRDYVKSIAPQAAQANLKLSLLSPITIPIPSVRRQREIVLSLDAKNAESEIIKKHLQSQLEAINALPAAILRQAFNGEL